MVDSDQQLPDLVIAGAPKCGTSSFFFWLAAHPAICGSRKKETHFLRDRVNRHNKDLNVHDHGLEAYGRAFPDCGPENLRTEATPGYLYDEVPVRELSKASPTPTVIFILRDPVERLHSSYRFNRFRRKKERVRGLSFADFADPSKPVFPGGVHPYDQSRYSRSLQRWKEAFPPSAIKIYLFERMKQDPKGFMKRVSKDLGIDPAFYDSYSFETRNPSRSIQNKWLHRLGERVQPLVPGKLQEKLVPLYMKLNSKEAPPPDREELEEKERLREEFSGEKEALQQLFPELDLSPWEKREDPSIPRSY
jgi:hypothetical protein